MFEIKCLVRDAKLSQALLALDNLTIEPPVVTAVMSHQQETQVRNPPGKTKQIVLDYIKKSRVREIKASKVKELVTNGGLSARNYSYALSQLIDDGILKKTATVGLYNVVNK